MLHSAKSATMLLLRPVGVVNVTPTLACMQRQVGKQKAEFDESNYMWVQSQSYWYEPPQLNTLSARDRKK
jgi:hypothetical protein